MSNTLDYLIDRIETFGDALAVSSSEGTASYKQLAELYRHWQDRLLTLGLPSGRIISFEGEYGPQSIAMFLAAITGRHICVPLTRDSRSHHDRFLEIAQVQHRFLLDGRQAHVETGVDTCHELYSRLQAVDHPGLVLFTSGSTGESKAAVHDVTALLEKFVVPRQRLRTIVFLQLDHIGGINTLLYTLSNGGAVIVPKDRSAASVCQAISQHRVELLPTSPTFLNLLLLSEEYKRHDLSSLRLITYGTEPMPASTLERINSELPQVQLQQTYGMTELGILRSKSRDSRSLWMRVGGEGYETKVVDGRLFVRAKSAMLGYLNAPSPFDADGYLDTGDQVEVDGEWLRILGRKSEIINVGGNKVHPSEVESVLLQMERVVDAAVWGESHPLTGQIVTATVQLSDSELPADFRTRMRLFCQSKLPTYAIPARVRVADQPLYNERFKRMRRVHE